MAELDILSPAQEVDTPIYLEACAGAGKTFTIEHLVVRLLCHPDLDQRRRLDQIAVITFTRAAAADLRRRIQQCITGLLEKLRQEEVLPPYFNHPDEATRRIMQSCLELALFSFDRAWVGTIHGFCNRLLRKFGTNLSDLVRASQEQLLPAAVEQEWILEFLRYGIPESDVGKGQWICLAKHFKSGFKLAEALRKHRARTLDTPSWHLQREILLKVLASSPCRDAEAIHTAWLSYAPGFKGLANRAGVIHPEWMNRSWRFAQLLAHPTAAVCDQLIREGCPWLEAFREDRLKRRMDGWVPEGMAAQIMLWVQNVLAPVLAPARNPDAILRKIQSRLVPLYRQWLAHAGCTQPDILIERVFACSEDPNWCAQVGTELRTLIVDEFQDTDPYQWKIFSRLKPFLQLVLVGDPKQSIYAFREADLYTYLEASRSFEEHQRWTLTRCYRSSKPVIDAINWCMDTLEGMDLPRIGERLFVPTTLPRLDPPTPLSLAGMQWAIFEQGKGRGKWPSRKTLEQHILPALTEQIFDLHQHGMPWESMVVIVRDRYQAAQVADALGSRGIPSFTARGRSWSDRKALPILRDLIETLCHPDEEGALLRLLASPLGAWSPEALRSWRTQPLLRIIREDLLRMQHLLFSQGIMAAVGVLIETRWAIDRRSSQLELEWSELMRDLVLLAESLSSLEQQNPSLGLLWSWTLQEVMAGRVLLPEEAAPAPPQAVQIMTIHMSKGLEFEAVFALGLCSRTPSVVDQDLAEIDAEKLRQLYVVITRAKRFLWIPIVCDTSGKGPKPGECAPIELLLARILARHEGLARQPLQDELYLLGNGGREALEAWIAKASPQSMSIQALHIEGPLRTLQTDPGEILQSVHLTSWPAILSWSSFTAEAEKSLPTTPRTAPIKEESSQGEENVLCQPLPIIPTGKAFGIAWHQWMQKRIERIEPLPLSLIQQSLQNLEPHHLSGEALAITLQALIEQCMNTPFWKGHCLHEIPMHLRRAEVSFLLHDRSKTVRGWRGSIDLVAEFDGELIAVDWKTHDLGPNPSDYSQERLKQCLLEGDYYLQARLYLASLKGAGWRTHAGPPRAFLFVFVRGIALGMPSWVSVTEEDLYGML